MQKILKINHEKRSDTYKPIAIKNHKTICHLAFDNSIQANIISAVRSGKIIVANSAACKLLGYSKKELLTKSRADILDLNESSIKEMLKKRTANGHVKALVSFIKKGNRAFTCEFSSVVFKDGGSSEILISTIVDMSQSILKQKRIDLQKEKIVADNIVLAKAKSDEEKLDIEGAAKAEYEENFKLIFNSSSDVLYDDDLVDKQVLLSNAYEKEFGYKLINNTTSMENLFSHIHPEDKEVFMQDYQRMLASEDTEWKYTFRFLKSDESVANLFTSGIVLRNVDGKAYRRIGYIKDISKQIKLEERLEQEIQLRERQIAEATLEAKEIERSEIGKELHDNVNQLLGASRMYINLAKGGGNDIDMYLSRSSEYTLTAIEEIRKLTKGLTTDAIKVHGLCESIEMVSRDTMEISPVTISCSLDSYIENRVNDQFRKDTFRIVQEQLNNILKHAKATEVTISLSQSKKIIILSISDNGVGFDTGKKQKGIGIANIKSRAMSYNGTADFISQPSQGCVLVVTFPVTDALLNAFSIA
jgi:PAS domain S-box-containing protein